MAADLASLEAVIRHTGRVVLFFSPIEAPAAVQRVWCLYEILTLLAITDDHGRPSGELRLGFTDRGKKEMYTIARAFMDHDFSAAHGKATRGGVVATKEAKKLLHTIEQL